MSNKVKKWYKLDNAGKIFPPTSDKNDPKVFRFACELYEDVDKLVLQNALDKTLEEFPMFLSSLKKGLFWYYLETSSVVPKVLEEENYICDKMDKDLLRLLSQANAKYTEYKIKLQTLDFDSKYFLDSILLSESLKSTQIEGTQISQDEMYYLKYMEETDNNKVIQNLKKTVEYAYEKINTGKDIDFELVNTIFPEYLLKNPVCLIDLVIASRYTIPSTSS